MSTIALQEAMTMEEGMARLPEPIGWYVRVTTSDVHDGVYDSILYIAGFATPAGALDAVRGLRSTPTDSYEVLPGEITVDRGPQPTRGEVRLLNGAV